MTTSATAIRKSASTAVGKKKRPAARAGDLVIVANRLPVHRTKRNGKAAWERSPGGLVSALDPILSARPCTWLGWPGVAGPAPAPFNVDEMTIHPVQLSAAEQRSYYDGFCNGTLWPLYHDAVRTPEFRRRWWWPYVTVNGRFAEAAAEIASHNGTVWVHDYQLQLVPGMLRALRPDLRIGFFLHIPFPPQELFARLPWRQQLLEGLLGADVVGCQTKRGAANFGFLARRYTEAKGTTEQLEFQGRTIKVDAYPISIDFDLFERTASSPEVAREAEHLRERLGVDRKIFLGVDRLDYTKGIDTRLLAFRELLDQGHVDPEKCAMVQVAVPSRERVSDYRELRSEIERLVGEINGRFARLGHSPVQYFHRNLEHRDLVALYTVGDVMVVTPHRDGMNLVAKEYVACRTHNTGALVLSEFTGAARQLKSAFLVNPHDIDGLATTFEMCLNLDPAEQGRRMRALRRAVRENNVDKWARSFIKALRK